MKVLKNSKSRVGLLLILFLLAMHSFMYNASARDTNNISYGIFDVLNFTILSDSKQITYSFTESPKMIQKNKVNKYGKDENGYIEGYVTILGYKNMSMKNGEYYVHGKVEDNLVVKYDGWVNFSGCETCKVQKLTKNLTIIRANNKTIASLEVDLFYYFTSCGIKCIKNERNEWLIVQDSIDYVPKSYDCSIDNVTADITEYNNTYNPKTLIYISNSTNCISSIKVEYDKNVIIRYLKVGTLGKTEENVSYANMINVDIWKISGSNSSRIGDYYVLNMSNIDYRNLNITVSNFYSSKKISNYNITRITFNPEDTWNPVLFGFLGVIGVMIWGIKKAVETLEDSF